MGTKKNAYERLDSYHTCLRGVTSLNPDIDLSKNPSLSEKVTVGGRLTPTSKHSTEHL